MEIPEIINPELAVELLNRLKKQGYITIINKQGDIALRTKLLNNVIGEVDTWIDEYRNLWKNTILGGRGPKSACVTKMELFIKNNPDATKDKILKAAKIYIDQQAINGYKYLQRADYFISKEEKGVVTSRLEAYLDEVDIDTPNTFVNGSDI